MKPAGLIDPKRQGLLQHSSAPLEEWLDSLSAIPGEVMARVTEAARPARHAQWPRAISGDVVAAYRARGIERPYTHQAEAMLGALAGKDQVIVTPTASGKSLCYTAPILSECLRDEEARALLVFPTKALALDQVMGMREIAACLPQIPIATFDGDTPSAARTAVRKRGRIVVTNPDMLHSGILPHHARWASLFQGLRFIVVDELHAYRGVFGSHLGNVLRRLLRICAFHGSEPTFVLCSATIANPREHARALTGRSVALVDENGAPRGERHLIFLNPPVVAPELGIRASARNTVRRLALKSLGLGLQTITFATSRLAVEVLTRYLREGLQKRKQDPNLVSGYRGGYLPAARRDIQKRLRDGTLRGVVTTSALELGVDVGSLDVAILCGYPGSIASTWQQLGRAGRRGKPAACILVARSTPLDQHVVTRPDYFLGASPEHARTDPNNLLVLVEHVKCAAFELPFTVGESFGTLTADETGQLLGVLAEEALVLKEGDTWHWTQESHPAGAVSLRSVSSDNFLVVDTTETPHRVIAEVDFPSAPTTLHEKAIYMLGAVLHQVDRLDYEGRKAYVTRVDCDYYTDAMTYRKVAVLESFESFPPTPMRAATRSHHGELRVSRKVVGFKKIRFYTGENLGYGDVVLPEHEMHSAGAWFTLLRGAVNELTTTAMSSRELAESLAGVANTLRTIATVMLGCDRHDLDTALGDARGSGEGGGRGPGARGRPEAQSSAAVFEPTLFLFETIPGGTGFAELLWRNRERLLGEALNLVRSCRCESGCPCCVGPPLEVGEACRAHATKVLELLLREQQA